MTRTAVMSGIYLPYPNWPFPATAPRAASFPGNGDWLRLVTVHGLVGDWSIFRRKNAFRQSTVAENLDLSPSRGKGGQSHFRGGQALSEANVPRRKNRDSPL